MRRTRGLGTRGIVTLLAAALALGWASIAEAQTPQACSGVSFYAAGSYATGTYPMSVAVGDFNGDAQKDLAVANWDSANVSILLGNGDGSFQTAVNYAAGTYPISVAVGDFDGDTHPDLAVANFGSYDVSILLGNGNGTFQAAVSYAAGENTYSVAVGDFDGDTHPDLAVANGGDPGAVSILLGNGDGTFQAAVNHAAGTVSTSVAVGDFNGDAQQDLAVANYSSNNVSILLGNGDGSFQARVNYAAGTNPYSVAVGDFDGDAKQDLAVANYGSNHVSILLGDGDGTFQAAVNYAAGTNPYSVAVGDFNGDAKQDLAVANYGSDNVSILQGNGNGTFQAAVNHAAGTTPMSVAVGDFNGDAQQDLAVANRNSGNVSILRGNGDGSFQIAVNYAAEDFYPSFVAVGDFNGDAKPDLAAASNLGVSILLGSGGGTFQAAVDYAAEGLFPSSVALGDFNGDAKQDLAVANAQKYEPAVSILLGNGDGTLQAAANYGEGFNPRSVAVGDFNGDAKQDLAIAHDTATVSILLGIGDGTFQDGAIYDTVGYPYSVAVGDFDGDAKQDLAVANGWGGVSILLGNGDGTFQSAVEYAAGTSVGFVAVGDFDGDTHPDLAVANSSSPGTVSILLGNGDGTFQAAVNYAAGSWPSSVAVGDFDGDGTQDVVVANYGSNNVSILLGNGDGTFQAAVGYAAGTSPTSVAVGDFDGDAKPDLAVAHPLGVSILLNNTPPYLIVNDASVTEGHTGSTSLTFTVTLSCAATAPLTVNYATADGTATAGMDYAATAGALTFASGQTFAAFAVGVIGDTVPEPDETLLVNLSGASRGSIGRSQGVGTILNDDPVPVMQFSGATYSVTEGAAATTITVTRSRVTAGLVTVDYATGGGTATPGIDYAATAGTLTFVAGQTRATFAVSIVNDTLNDPNETVNLALSNPQGQWATLGSPSTAVLTIVDNDPAGSVQFSAAAYSVSESGPVATITVTRTAGTASGVTVDHATSDGTATSPADYAATAGTLTFAAGQTSATFTVPIVDDTIGENNETVGLTLSNPRGGATLGTVRSAILTILENERVVQFSAPTVTVSEGVPTATITVKRSGLLTGSVIIEYATSDGTAKAGVDYQAQAGTLSFGPNVTSKVVTIPIVNDTLDEPDETVLVRLRNPVNGAPGPVDSVVLTITDNDTGGVVQFGVAAYSVAENKTTATITVTRTGGVAGAVTVGYAATAGTATAAVDFATVSGTLSFGANQAATSFTVPIIADALAEGAETVIVTLSSPSGGATLGARSTAVLTILDDEVTVELVAATFSVTEGGTASVAVKRTGALTGTVSVPYATTDGTAHGGLITDPSRDYTATSGTLTFGPNVTSKTFTVSTTNDTLNEASQTFNLTLGTPTGASLGHQASAVVTIVDNDAAGVVQFGAATYSVNESTPSVAISVTRSGGTASGVTVGYAAAAGTATASVDFTPVSGETLTFAANQATLSFSVPILNDTEAEGAETVLLSLGPVVGGATLGPRSTATLTINDNDSPQFQFSAATYSVNEATAKATITVKRIGSVALAATVQYATSDGTASAGADYAAAAGTLSFAANVATKTLTVTIVNDTVDEPDETVNLTLSSPSPGSHLGSPSTAVLTIVDNDTAGTVQFGAPAFSAIEGELGTTSLARITVTRTGGAASAATVDYVTSNGTATSGSDYTGTAGTLTFAAAVTSKTFAVEILGDAVAEGNETVNMTLQNPGGGLTLGALRAAKLWIVEPAGAAKLVFIHHSTGENWLNDANGQLGKALRDNNYFVSDTNYGWGPGYSGGTGTIGDHTDIGEWYEWFVGTSSATYLTALYDEFEQHASYARLSDPEPTRKNEIVVFKSCFPNSHLSGNPDDPPTVGVNPLRGEDASSPEMTVANAKGIYNDLLAYFAAHQEKLFVVVTAPPLVAGDTSPEEGANARAVNHWLVNDWLTGYAHNNVAVFDFYNVLTSNGGTAAVNDLGKETGNHHRWWNGAVQHAHPVAMDISAYPTSTTDSHPTAAGGKKATGECVTLLNFYYNRWKGLPITVGRPGVKGKKASARFGPEAIAPPGSRNDHGSVPEVQN